MKRQKLKKILLTLALVFVTIKSVGYAYDYFAEYSRLGTTQTQAWHTDTWNQLVKNDYKPFERDGFVIMYNPYSDDMEIVKK